MSVKISYNTYDYIALASETKFGIVQGKKYFLLVFLMEIFGQSLSNPC